MNLIRFYRVSAVVVVGQLLLAAWGLAQVGFGVEVPIHWGPTGEVDGYASSGFAFLMLPAITAGIVALLGVVPRIEPRRENLRRSASAYRTTGIAVVLLMGVIQVGVVMAGVTGSFPMATVIGFGIGLLFAVMGNVMTTVRPNMMFGVRTPWTLTSDLAWDRTHRLVGRLFVVTGLGMIVLALTGQMLLVIGFMVAALVVTLVAGFWYSYRVWKTDPDRRTAAGGGAA